MHTVTDSNFDVVFEIFDVIEVDIVRVDLYLFNLQLTVDGDFDSWIIIVTTGNNDNYLCLELFLSFAYIVLHLHFVKCHNFLLLYCSVRLVGV